MRNRGFSSRALWATSCRNMGDYGRTRCAWLWSQWLYPGQWPQSDRTSSFASRSSDCWLPHLCNTVRKSSTIPLSLWVAQSAHSCQMGCQLGLWEAPFSLPRISPILRRYPHSCHLNWKTSHSNCFSTFFALTFWMALTQRRLARPALSRRNTAPAWFGR